MKDEEEICVSFAVVPQIAKLTVSDKCLVKMEEVLNLYKKNFFNCRIIA